MKVATKRAVSEAFLHMLTVTAMLVIVSVLFYGKPPARSSFQQATATQSSAQPVAEIVRVTLTSDGSSARNDSQ